MKKERQFRSRVSIPMNENLLKRLEEEADRTGFSVPTVCTMILTNYFDGLDKQEAIVRDTMNKMAQMLSSNPEVLEQLSKLNK